MALSLVSQATLPFVEPWQMFAAWKEYLQTQLRTENHGHTVVNLRGKTTLSEEVG